MSSKDTLQRYVPVMPEEPAAHVFSSILDAFKRREMFASAFSVPCRDPDLGMTEPLYTDDHVRAPLEDAHAHYESQVRQLGGLAQVVVPLVNGLMPTSNEEDRMRMGWSDSDEVAAEYAETYARAQAQAAFWIWHALTHGRAPDMLPQELLRPSGRIAWVRDAEAMKPPELMTPAELEEAYAASATEMPQLDHNWRTGQQADPPEVIDAMMRRKMVPQKLDWSESSDVATGAGDL